MKSEFYMRDLMRTATLTIQLRGVRRFRLRVWLGLHLMRLAAAVMGVGVSIVGIRKLRGGVE